MIFWYLIINNQYVSNFRFYTSNKLNNTHADIHIKLEVARVLQQDMGQNKFKKRKYKFKLITIIMEILPKLGGSAFFAFAYFSRGCDVITLFHLKTLIKRLH